MSAQPLATWHEEVSGAPGNWSLCVLGAGTDLTDAADRPHPAASIIKIPILTTTLGLVDSGQLHLDEPVAVPGAVGGAGALCQLDLESVTLRQALALMITISDNVATNAVIGHVGMDAFRQAWRTEHHDGFRLNRLLGHTPRTPADDNYATAASAARCLLELEQGGKGESEAARFGLELLARQQFRDRIPSFLPADVECLNKTGELPRVRHDVALLRRSGRTVAVAMMASDLPDATGTTGGGLAAGIMGRSAATIATGCLPE